MTTVLPHIQPAVEPRPVPGVAPAAPRSAVPPLEPADPRPRYWDHEIAGWRPAPA